MTPGAAVVRSIIRAYQLGFSSWRAPSCRFFPSCSEYAMQAYATHSFLSASGLTLKRICRCHPWGASGFDPVPEPAVKLLPRSHENSKDC